MVELELKRFREDVAWYRNFRPGNPPETPLTRFKGLRRTINVVGGSINEINSSQSEYEIPLIRPIQVRVVDQRWLGDLAEWDFRASLHPTAQEIYDELCGRLGVKAHFYKKSLIYSPRGEERVYLSRQWINKIRSELPNPDPTLPHYDVLIAVGALLCLEQWRKAAGKIVLDYEDCLPLALYGLERHHKSLENFAIHCEEEGVDLSVEEVFEGAAEARGKFYELIDENFEEIDLEIRGASFIVRYQGQALFPVGLQTDANVITELSWPLMRAFLSRFSDRFKVNFDQEGFINSVRDVAIDREGLEETLRCLEEAFAQEIEEALTSNLGNEEMEVERGVFRKAYFEGEIPQKFAEKFLLQPVLFL